MTVPQILDSVTHLMLLRVCSALMDYDPPLGSIHGEYLSALATAIEDYEKKTCSELPRRISSQR